MDFIKSAISNAGGDNNQNNNNNDNNQGGDNNQNNQGDNNQNNQDYVDKAFSAISKKAGYNINPETEEKITDGVRDAYVKYSGKQVDPKISN